MAPTTGLWSESVTAPEIVIFLAGFCPVATEKNGMVSNNRRKIPFFMAVDI
jgi:hypothetical protein